MNRCPIPGADAQCRWCAGVGEVERETDLGAYWFTCDCLLQQATNYRQAWAETGLAYYDERSRRWRNMALQWGSGQRVDVRDLSFSALRSGNGAEPYLVAVTIAERFARALGNWKPAEEPGEAVPQEPAERRFAGNGEFMRGVVFSGVPGVGKTVLGLVCILEAWKAGRSVRFWNCPEQFGAIRASYGSRSEPGEGEIVSNAINCDVLLLDDLGASTNTNHEQAILYRILDERFRREAPTIITTNAALYEQVLKAIGDRLADRINDFCHWVEFPEASFRQERAFARSMATTGGGSDDFPF